MIHIYLPCSPYELHKICFFKLCCCEKKFTTRITFVIFLAIMNYLDVDLQCFKYRAEKMIYHMIYICDICGLHELCRCVSSKIVLEKMIYHRIHICDLCGPHEFYGCASSNFQVVKMIYHMICICDLCGLHG